MYTREREFNVDRVAAKSFSNASLLISVAEPRQFPADIGVEIAFAGRSNAGKSSAINALTGRRDLARVSKTPGRTRLVNFFELAPNTRLVDLPGYGYAEVSNAERAAWQPLLAALRVRSSLRGMFLMVDARRGVQAEDRELIAWADPTFRPVHILLTKSDKLTRNEGREALAHERGLLGSEIGVQLFSAQDGTGLDSARRRLREMLAK